MEGSSGSLKEQTLVTACDVEEDDVEMVDAETLDGGAIMSRPLDSASTAGDGAGDGGQGGRNKRKRKKNRKRNKPSNPSNIADINRFVLDTCRRLKEKKSYLVWNAIGCLGVTSVSDLIKEVYAIEKCGGQMTADGKRLRTGGGILWNILKTREPKAYKEIMTKGREFEKQLRRPKINGNKQETVKSKKDEDTNSQTSSVGPEEEIQLVDANEPLNNDVDQQEVEEENNRSDNKNERKSVRERIRVPVSYDDLFEDGEIHE